MALRLPKPVRNFVFKARKRNQRYQEKRWLKTKQVKGETSGTHYRNFAGERFKINREKFEIIGKSPLILMVKMKVSVLAGNKELEQTIAITIELGRSIVDVADINVGKESNPPKQKLKGRNMLGAIFEEAELIGREKFGNSTFKLQVTPTNDILRKKYEKFGFHEYDPHSNGLEKIISSR